MALIYDVGMFNGDDSRYYLHQGHTVVAIEANPAYTLKDERVTVLNVAIAPEEGDVDFWVCDDNPVWSSLDRAIASREGSKHHSIKVPARPFRDIVREYGLPYYLKIDVEGADMTVIRDIEKPPQYISVESECLGSAQANFLDTLRLLERKGYRRFKLVNQFTLASMTQAGSLVWPDDEGGARRELEERLGWRFPEGSSGPWGEDVAGNWIGYTDAVDLYCRLRQLFFTVPGHPPYSFWFDWHATLP